MIEHNVPVQMSTTHTSLVVFLVVSIFAFSPLISLPPSVSLTFSVRHDCMPQDNTTTQRLRSSIYPTTLNESLQSPSSLLSLLSLPPSLTPSVPAPSPAAAVSPPPPSELHCECLVQQPQPLLQYAALPFHCAA
ncbi:unnamed protein product [Pleuronectes platessa]|uniref:Uncharacterized protein n=1 Tax=Pleuronectes platessa TaxID=8262 RepID=A0A9N7YN00_PLEPL|nr:unnamed protein product [Pleuronectes platessa]